MNMRSICTRRYQSTTSYRNIRDSHKITCSECVQICQFWSYIASSGSNSMYLNKSFFMKSKCPEKCEKVVCSRVTVDEYLRHFCGMSIYHITRIHYFLVFCKRIFGKFLLKVRFQNMSRKTPKVIAISAILKTEKYCTLIKSVTDPNRLRSRALRNHPVMMSIYQIFSRSDSCFHDLRIQ